MAIKSSRLGRLLAMRSSQLRTVGVHCLALCIALLGSSVLGRAQCDWLGFPGEQCPVGSGPYSVTRADLDGDGDQDLVTANFFDSTVSVLLNQRNVTFTAHVPYVVGSHPFSVTCADLDGDGDVDLASANSNPLGTISVLLNLGNGTFAVQVPYAVGSYPRGVTSADLDGDGDQDLVTSNGASTSGTVSVLLNLGNGTFAAHQQYATGVNPNSVTSADLDGDGDQDLVTANGASTSSTVSVLLNQGNGIFAAHQQYAAGVNPNSVISADLDGDGDQDLVTANGASTSGTVSVLLNQGNGTFAAYQQYATGVNPKSVTSADLDGDGDDDLVSANSASNTLSVMLNLGNATFATPVQYAVGSDPLCVISADLDGDGDQDLACANEVVNSVSVLLNQGNGTFPAHVQHTVGAGPSSVTCADLDGDGDQDLASANYNSNTVSVLLNQGDGTFPAHVQYAVGANPSSVTSVDLDGDGDQDLATANYNSNTVSVLLNQGVGTFAPHMQYTVGVNPSSVISVDLDGDGDRDLATANYNSNTVSVLLNHGNGTFAPHVRYSVGLNCRSVVSADLDGDGDMDLASANFGSFAGVSTISVLINQGNGAFAGQVQYAVGVGTIPDGPFSLTSADLDGDGDHDLVTANYYSHAVSVLLNQGNGTFGWFVKYGVGFNPDSVICTDLDADGDQDITCANLISSTVSVLLNLGSGNFAAQTYFAVDPGPSSVVGVDLDGNGNQDLACANGGTDSVSVLLNRGSSCGSIHAICSPGSGGVLACPCGNPPVGAGQGCSNSLGAGASIGGLGLASLTTDTLVVSATGIGSSGASCAGSVSNLTCILLQGNGVNAGGLAFNDGVRCFTGSLKRLRTATSSAGVFTSTTGLAASSAALGDPIAAGTKRWYGVWYRDPCASWGCAGANSNVSNTLEVAWKP